MKPPTRFSELFERARQHVDYFVYGVIWEFGEGIVARMESLGLSKSELARRLQCKPAYITKVLRGSTNFTLESMVKIAHALDADLHVDLKPREEQWNVETTITSRSAVIQPTELCQPKNLRASDFPGKLVPFDDDESQQIQSGNEISIAA